MDTESNIALLSPELSDEEDLKTKSPWHTSPQNHPRRDVTIRWLLFTNVVWTITLAITSILYLVSSRGPQRSNEEFRTTSTPSPLFDAIPLGPYARTVSGTLHDNNSLFRQAPSKEVDHAWEEIALHDAQLINVTAADIEASGHDPTNRVRWSPDEDSYPAQVEFSHKIHCLNTIRKEIWGEYYFGEFSIHASDADSGENEDSNLHLERKKHRQHAMHCLHIVLQDLMCTVDVGIITHEWINVPGRPDDDLVPMADFSTKKQCRNYEAAAGWVRGHSVEDGLDKFASLKNSDKSMASKSEDNYW